MNTIDPLSSKGKLQISDVTQCLRKYIVGLASLRECVVLELSTKRILGCLLSSPCLCLILDGRECNFFRLVWVQ